MPEDRVFYSRCGGLTFWPDPVQQVIMGGTMQVVTGAPIKFTPLGSTNFGHFTATTPAHIEALERRIREVGDVMSADEFNRAIMPKEDQIKSLEERVRELEQKNSLLEQMKAAGKINPPVLGGTK